MKINVTTFIRVWNRSENLPTVPKLRVINFIKSNFFSIFFNFSTFIAEWRSNPREFRIKTIDHKTLLNTLKNWTTPKFPHIFQFSPNSPAFKHIPPTALLFFCFIILWKPLPYTKKNIFSNILYVLEINNFHPNKTT